jgi:DNA polymerase
VFGEGSKDARVVFVGEGPGQKEDEQGRPFVGRAGVLLTNKIETWLGLYRHEVDRANSVKWRPPGNRAPEEDEAHTCMPYLKRQLEIINPKIIVTLGNTPKKYLTGVEIGITKVRGDWLEWRGIPVMPTYHPAYLLRNNNKIPEFEEDLAKVLNLLRNIPHE